MKNKISRFAIAFNLVFTGMSFGQVKPTSPATAASTIENKPQAKSEKAPATVLMGKVTSVDAMAGRLRLMVKDKQIDLTTDSKTTKAALEKLKVGDTAKVFERDGKVIAASPVKPESKTKARK